MEALVYHGPGRRAWENRPRPEVQDATDAVVRITTSTICGTDLHIRKGDVPTVTDVMKAYDVFGNAAKERALKVVLANR